MIRYDTSCCVSFLPIHDQDTMIIESNSYIYPPLRLDLTKQAAFYRPLLGVSLIHLPSPANTTPYSTISPHNTTLLCYSLPH